MRHPRARSTRRRRGVIGAAIPAALLLAAGCQTEKVVSSDGRPMPEKPRPAPRVPAGAQPNTMTLVVSPRPEDADGNGYPDRIQVASSLFSVPHPTPMTAEGAFVFTLFRHGEARQPGAEPIAEWRFEADQVRAARGNVLYGTAYRFSLSLLEVGSDRISPVRADVRGRFEPADGGPVVHSSDEVRLVQLGRFSDVD
jgi:hypothetical protein